MLSFHRHKNILWMLRLSCSQKELQHNNYSFKTFQTSSINLSLMLYEDIGNFNQYLMLITFRLNQYQNYYSLESPETVVRYKIKFN